MKGFFQNSSVAVSGWVCALILGVALAVAISHSASQAQATCDAVSQADSALRQVLQLSEQQTQTNTQYLAQVRKHPEIAQQTQDFYNKALALVQPITC